MKIEIDIPSPQISIGTVITDGYVFFLVADYHAHGSWSFSASSELGALVGSNGGSYLCVAQPGSVERGQAEPGYVRKPVRPGKTIDIPADEAEAMMVVTDFDIRELVSADTLDNISERWKS